jgi:hypothetical protein
VDLAIAEHRPRAPPVVIQARRIAAESSDGFGHRDAGVIGAIEVGWVEGSRHRSAAQVGRPEAQSLLVGECEHLDCERQPLVGVVKALDRGDRQTSGSATRPACSSIARRSWAR